MNPKRKTKNQQPLLGKRIVVTRSLAQAGELSGELRALGADVLELPTIKLLPPKDATAVHEAVEGIGEYEWLIFTSPNAVDFFFVEFFKRFTDIRTLGFIKIAAMGPGTAKKLHALHLDVDLQPEQAVAESLVKAFNKKMDMANVRFLLPRSEIARNTLARKLEELGGIVDDVEAYRNVIEDEDPTGAVKRLTAEGADVVTFASSSAAENFFRKVDVKKLRVDFPKLLFASIGPVTTQTAEKLGMPISIEPSEHTIPSLVKAIAEKLS